LSTRVSHTPLYILSLTEDPDLGPFLLNRDQGIFRTRSCRKVRIIFKCVLDLYLLCVSRLQPSKPLHFLAHLDQIHVK
jgi:hypothetical protein